MSRADVEASSQVIPIVPRFWWLKRIAVASGAIIVALVLLHLWWGRAADRRYRAIIESAHARGEPILPEDFDAQPIPDADNKALFLSKAAIAIKLSDEFSLFTRNYDEDQPLTAQELELIRQMLSANAEPLRLARQARSATGVDWQIRWRTPVITSGSFNHLNDQRNLAKLLRWSALYNHSIGNDHEAIEAVRDVYNQIDAVGRGPSMLVVELVTIGLSALACDTIERIAPSMAVELIRRSAASSPTVATRAQISRLIETLTDEEPFHQAALRGWYGERMQDLDAFQMVISADSRQRTSFHRALAGRDFFPGMTASIELDAVRAAKVSTIGAVAVAQPNWQAAQSFFPNLDFKASYLQELSTLLSHILTPAISRGIEQHFRDVVDRHASALRLAFRLYRLDHGGEYPSTLSSLVPAYLARVPPDPYAADGRPMSYRPDPKTPAIYSVGLNGKDDGGTSLPYPLPGLHGAWRLRWECADIVYPLEPSPPPATKPSVETENHE